jgi:NAD(P)-dependent dehydrogenase (short-subunit alcohol dehydrogenase family)
MGRLEGKTALVVGSGSGIGRAAAEMLAREGASLVCADVNEAGVAATVETITRAGGRAKAIVANVAEASAADALAQAPFAAYGALDVLVYSAGTSATASILEHTRSDWDRVIGVNLTGAFMLGQAVARRMVMQAKGGSIIFVTSQLANAAVRDKAAYLASKGGLRSLMMGWHSTSLRTTSASMQWRRGRYSRA